MTSLVTSWDDVLTQLPEKWLKRVQIFYYVAFPLFGAVTLLCGVYVGEESDLYLMGCGLGAYFYLIIVKVLPLAIKFVYALWFHFSALLILMGFALMRTHEGFSTSFYAVGVVCMGLLLLSPLLGCHIFVCPCGKGPASTARCDSDLKVEFRAVENEDEQN